MDAMRQVDGSGTAVTDAGDKEDAPVGYVPLGNGAPCNWIVLSMMP